MGMLDHWVSINRALDATLGTLGAIDRVTRDLESRDPLAKGDVEVRLVGPDGRPLGPGAVTQASTFGATPGAPGGAPGGGGGGLGPTLLPAPPGGEPRWSPWGAQDPQTVQEILQRRENMGRGVSAGLGQGGAGHGIRGGLPNAEPAKYDPEAIAAAVQDVIPISAQAYRSYSGKAGNAELEIILIAVSANGKNVPSDYLSVAAAWYAYTYLPSQSNKAGSTSSGGGNPLPGRVQRGVGTLQSTGPQGGADIGFDYKKSTAEMTKAVKNGANAGVQASMQVVSAVKELTGVVRSSLRGVGGRAEGAP